MPGLEVRRLGWADTEQDAQHLRVGDPLSERWVEAGASLLDKPKMEGRRVGNRLDVVMGGQVAIVSGNRRKLPFTQTRDSLSERITEIGVLRATAVAGPPAGVHRELHEVGEPSDLPGACRFTARQRAKLIQIDGIRALGDQIGVDEREVAELILGIVVDILVHIPIQLFKGSGVGSAPRPSWNFAVLDSSEFVILLPQIGFEDFGCSQEPEYGHVTLRNRRTGCSMGVSEIRVEHSGAQQPGADRSCSCSHGKTLEQGTTASRSFQCRLVLRLNTFVSRLLRVMFHDQLLIVAKSIQRHPA
ncbi:MAG TPA: hypothetical protein VEU97_07100 [Ktedonobacteraceae bacterium]|nr:hypothetical protein [Ktedonobacteraceae bacterium]